MIIGIFNFTGRKELIFLRRIYRIDIGDVCSFHTVKVTDPESYFCVKCEFVSMPLLLKRTAEGLLPIHHISDMREKYVKIALIDEMDKKINFSKYHFVGKLVKLSTMEDLDKKCRPCTLDVHAIEIARV